MLGRDPPMLVRVALTKDARIVWALLAVAGLIELRLRRRRCHDRGAVEEWRVRGEG
jgi:hypothetical protein